jgi:hypothetical protein
LWVAVIRRHSERAADLVHERGLRADVIKAQRVQPGKVLGRPGASRSRIAFPSPQKELPEAMAGTHQIAANVLDRAHQVAEALILDGRHKRETQLSGRKQPGQADRVATIGLDPVARALWD